MSNWKKSASACFLREKYGGLTPVKSMQQAIEKLTAKSPTDSTLIRPSRYAKWCRTDPKPLFIQMDLDGALKLDGNRFKIIIRDATTNLSLPFEEDVEASRRRKNASGQLVLCFGEDTANSAAKYLSDNCSAKQI